MLVVMRVEEGGREEGWGRVQWPRRRGHGRSSILAALWQHLACLWTRTVDVMQVYLLLCMSAGIPDTVMAVYTPATGKNAEGGSVEQLWQVRGCRGVNETGQQLVGAGAGRRVGVQDGASNSLHQMTGTTWPCTLHDEKHALALPVQTTRIKLLRPAHAGAIPGSLLALLLSTLSKPYTVITARWATCTARSLFWRCAACQPPHGRASSPACPPRRTCACTVCR